LKVNCKELEQVVKNKLLHTPWQFVSDIIKGTKHTIVLIDNYIHPVK